MANVTNYPTQEELREVFELKVDFRNGYETLWRKFLSTNQFGKKGEWFKVECKVNSSNGYCQVGFKERMIKYHTIVWILVNGDMPEDSMIDHISGDRIDNQLSNLRLSTSSDNNSNRQVHREGKLLGCYYHKQAKSWKAQKEINDKKIHLGYYDTEEEANQVYLTADKMRRDGFSLNFIQKMLRIKTKDVCSSQYRGVYWNKRCNRWRAHIKINDKLIHLGHYDSEEDASTVYLKARELMGQYTDNKQFRELLPLY